jgi:hypothetical protein
VRPLPSFVSRVLWGSALQPILRGDLVRPDDRPVPLVDVATVQGVVYDHAATREARQIRWADDSMSSDGCYPISQTEGPMQFNKQTIISLLTERGDVRGAQRAAKELPETVDHEQHASLLQKFHLDPNDFIKKAEGGELGKLGRDLPKL